MLGSAATAARWGAIAQIDVTTGDGGHPSLVLDNATLRFVPITDGRPEGLGGIDVAVTNVDEVRRRATDRGRWHAADGLAMICGMRIRPVEVA